jgi:IS4 transposase
MSGQDYAALPNIITVRELSVNGRVYVTTLLDNKSCHKQELAILYKARWKIGLDFRSIKTKMGIEMLRCKSPDRVR